MALTYNLGNIAQFKDNFDLAYQEYNDGNGKYTDVKPDLKSLIFASMTIGLSEITYKNVSEWYARLIASEEIYQYSLWQKWTGDEVVKITIEPKMLTQYLGLQTNANNRSRSEWVQNVIKYNKDIKYTSKTLTSKLRKLETEFQEKVFQ